VFKLLIVERLIVFKLLVERLLEFKLLDSILLRPILPSCMIVAILLCPGPKLKRVQLAPHNFGPTGSFCPFLRFEFGDVAHF
jgi:hypothetical protein